jgi:hypothetical protein
MSRSRRNRNPQAQQMNGANQNQSNSSSTANVLDCLCITAGTVAAISEENQARQAHLRGDHREESVHYLQAALLHNAVGNNTMAKVDVVEGAVAGSENNQCCIM